MSTRLQLVAVAATGLLFLVIFELVRRRHLMERYALLWLFSAAVLLALAAWKDALGQISRAVGIAYAPSAFFAVAFGFALILLLHFSLVVSRLADQNKVLAQRLGQLQERVDNLTAAQVGDDGGRAVPYDGAEEADASVAAKPQLTRPG
jgi:hypothetical protein